jgi:hypothetical protein
MNIKKSRRLRNHATVVRFAAWSYVLLAVLYPVFVLSSYQADKQTNVASFLEGVVQGTGAGHVWWLLFTLIPLLLVFGAIGFYSAVKPYSFKLAGLSLTFSVLSSLGFLLGIGRWSTLNWGFGEAFNIYKDKNELLTDLFNFSNEIMGFWFGHVLAELCLFVAIGLMSVAMFNSKRFPVWLSGFASFIFILGTVSVFRDFNILASSIHSFLNAFMLVPLFFILLAIGLYRFKGKSKEKPLKRYTKKKKTSKKKRNFFKKKAVKQKKSNAFKS